MKSRAGSSPAAAAKSTNRTELSDEAASFTKRSIAAPSCRRDRRSIVTSTLAQFQIAANVASGILTISFMHQDRGNRSDVLAIVARYQRLHPTVKNNTFRLQRHPQLDPYPIASNRIAQHRKFSKKIVVANARYGARAQRGI